MKEEFNLSEKIFYEKEWNFPNSIETKHVKEFIKRMKEEAEYFSEYSEPFIEVIDKLAGEKLI